MGRDELVRALEEKGRAEIEEVRCQVEAEADRYRADKEKEIDRQRHRCREQAADSAGQECRQVIWRVDRLMRSFELQARYELERRLQAVARDELDRLEPGLRRRCLERLGKEIPVGDWERVAVHPDDVEAAERLFSDCRVEDDDRIAGGLAIATGDGKIEINNTLNRRLEALWPEMGCRILKELEGDVDDSPVATAEE